MTAVIRQALGHLASEQSRHFRRTHFDPCQVLNGILRMTGDELRLMTDFMVSNPDIKKAQIAQEIFVL